MDWPIHDRWMLLETVTIGVLLMFLSNSFMGSRRRAWLRDLMRNSLHRSRDALTSAWHGVRSQARGIFAEARMFLRK
jgi:hypothetical protein